MEGSPRILFFSYKPRGDNLKILSQKCLLLGSSEPIEENYCHVSDCICLPVSWINLVISCFVDFLNISLTFINSPILELFRKSTKPEIMKFIHETGKQMQLQTLEFEMISFQQWNKGTYYWGWGRWLPDASIAWVCLIKQATISGN